MKIIFICSSLEPGKDGVGDYTRRLAAELIKQGHTAGIIALNDKYVNNALKSTQEDVPVLRTPAAFAFTERCAHAHKWIAEFNPDWLSLQFVPFGFHPKGLPVNLAGGLSTIADGRPWQVMFHELWVGMAVEESQKLFWWGRLQQYLIKRLLLKLQPEVIHTQTQLYQLLLSRIGFKAGYLPLFGNIPVIPTDTLTMLPGIVLVVFGLIHSGAPIAALAKDAANYSRKNNVSVELKFIGRCGGEQQRWAEAWAAQGLTVTIMGEQSAAQISEALSTATLGISATATAVIEKSGSVAAMREHGLTVLSISKSWQPHGVNELAIPEGVIIYQPGKFEACLAAAQRLPHKNDVSIVARQFINDLDAGL